MSGTSSNYRFPAFDDLPKVDGMPQGNIWGFYDKGGKKDEVGGNLLLSLIIQSTLDTHTL
jgi:hypothetical protein